MNIRPPAFADSPQQVQGISSAAWGLELQCLKEYIHLVLHRIGNWTVDEVSKDIELCERSEADWLAEGQREMARICHVRRDAAERFFFEGHDVAVRNTLRRQAEAKEIN